MYQLKDILNWDTIGEISWYHQNFLLSKPTHNNSQLLSPFLPEVGGGNDFYELLCDRLCQLPHKETLRILNPWLDDMSDGRNIVLQIRGKDSPDSIGVYFRISAYALLYFLRDDKRDLSIESHDLSSMIQHHIRSILNNEYGFREIQMTDSMLKMPINIFGEFHWAPIYSNEYFQYMSEIPIWITFDDLREQYLYQWNDIGMQHLSGEERFDLAKQDFISMLKQEPTSRPLLVNRENKLVLRQYNLWDLLFFEN